MISHFHIFHILTFSHFTLPFLPFTDFRRDITHSPLTIHYSPHSFDQNLIACQILKTKVMKEETGEMTGEKKEEKEEMNGEPGSRTASI